MARSKSRNGKCTAGGSAPVKVTPAKRASAKTSPAESVPASDVSPGEEQRPPTGLMPLDYLLSLVRDESLDRPARVDAAKAAAPYCHARLASLDHRGGLTLTHEQALEELD